MWLYILQGIGYGLTAAAQPGPFQTYLISQTLLKGWKKTLPAAFAPLISDGPIIALCLLVLSQVPPWFQGFLYLAGGTYILYLAYGAYKSWRTFDLDLASIEAQQSIFKAALINALNPNPYIFWSLVTGPILLAGWRQTQAYGLGFMLGFYLAMILFQHHCHCVRFHPANGTESQSGPVRNFCHCLIWFWVVPIVARNHEYLSVLSSETVS